MADYMLRTIGGLPYVLKKTEPTCLISLVDPVSDIAEAVAYRAWLMAGNAPDPDPDAGLDPTVPPVVTKRQFWMQLAVAGHINEVTAQNAMNGDIPDAIETFIMTLPIGERFAARMRFKSDNFGRYEPVTPHTKATFALSDAQVNQFFKDAALL